MGPIPEITYEMRTALNVERRDITQGTVAQTTMEIMVILHLVTVVAEARARLVRILLRNRANLVVTKDPLRSLFLVLLILVVV